MIVTAMAQLDTGAQHGAVSSEELAVTAEEISAQVEELRITIGVFKLHVDGKGTQPSTLEKNASVSTAVQANLSTGKNGENSEENDFVKFG